MYSLIIVLVAIALAVLLALATLYYGSEAWFKNDTEAQVATVVNQAQQISAAYTLHHTEKNAIADSIPSLVELNYLKTVPEFKSVAWRALVAKHDTLFLPKAVNRKVCKVFNQKFNKVDGIPRYPVKSWAYQCYGVEDEFNVLWKGTSDRSIDQLVDDAYYAGVDSKGDPIVPIDVDALDDPSNQGGGNTWTELPSGVEPVPTPPDDEEPPPIPRIDLTYNMLHGFFWEMEFVIPDGSKYLSKYELPLQRALISCAVNSAGSPNGIEYVPIYYATSYSVDGTNLRFNLTNGSYSFYTTSRYTLLSEYLSAPTVTGDYNQPNSEGDYSGADFSTIIEFGRARSQLFSKIPSCKRNTPGQISLQYYDPIAGSGVAERNYPVNITVLRPSELEASARHEGVSFVNAFTEYYMLANTLELQEFIKENKPPVMGARIAKSLLNSTLFEAVAGGLFIEHCPDPTSDCDVNYLAYQHPTDLEWIPGSTPYMTSPPLYGGDIVLNDGPRRLSETYAANYRHSDYMYFYHPTYANDYIPGTRYLHVVLKSKSDNKLYHYVKKVKLRTDVLTASVEKWD